MMRGTQKDKTMETLAMSIIRDKGIVEKPLKFPAAKFDCFWIDKKDDQIHYYIGGIEFVCTWTQEREDKCINLCG